MLKSWLILTSLYNCLFFLDIAVSPDRPNNFTYVNSSIRLSVRLFVRYVMCNLSVPLVVYNFLMIAQ